jgi:myotubularin-related protein 6/7/8
MEDHFLTHVKILPEGRSPEDEKYLSCIVEANPASKYLYIVDTRPKINALYNRSGTSFFNILNHKLIK